MLLLWLFYIYSHSAIIVQPSKCNILPWNIFNQLLTYLPAWITKFPTKIQLKPSLLRINVFLPTQSNKSLRKTATRHPVERSFRNRRVRHIFCKRTPTALKSQIHPCKLRLKDFCGSQRCSPSREQRYYGLIELKPRTPVRKLFKIVQTWWFKYSHLGFM